jgi:hypothetical protein
VALLRLPHAKFAQLPEAIVAANDASADVGPQLAELKVPAEVLIAGGGHGVEALACCPMTLPAIVEDANRKVLRFIVMSKGVVR